MDFLRQHVFHNIGLKMISIIAAVGLWYGVTREPMAEVALRVPIEFLHNAPDQLEISTETIPEIQVRVRGPLRSVRDLSPSEVHAVIDLANAHPGEHTYDFGANRIHVPQGVEFVQAVPSQIRITLDERASREVPVMPRVIGTFLPGYQLKSVSVQPKMVTIVGPSSHVRSVEAAVTDPVDATGVVGSATFPTHAYVSDPLVRLGEPTNIHVTVVTGQSASNSK